MATLATVTIPLVTLNGTQVSIPVAIPQGVTWARLSIDRAVGAQSLNAQPTAQVSLLVDVSLDGLAWQPEVRSTTDGGIVIIGGVQQDTSFVNVQPIEGDPTSTTRLARATVTTNMAVSLSGALSLGS